MFIPQALPQIRDLFEPADIIQLAQQEEVVCRLLEQHSADDWRLKQGPFNQEDFAQLPEKWTLLIQNMEQWSIELGELWQAFGFIPQWQRDDIMVSYAPKGGSVGMHYDEYDVFLLQGYGHRRWQLGKFCDPSTEFKPNQPIRIFDDMGELIFDQVLEAGDLLYVPSRLSHYGVAQDDCLTFSFGLRYPCLQELIGQISQSINQPHGELALDQLMIPLRLRAEPQPQGLLDADTITQIKHQLLERLANSQQFDQLLTEAVAHTLSSRRYELLISEEMADIEQLRTELIEQKACLKQDSNSKLLYLEHGQQLRIYANGQYLDELNEVERLLLQRLANGEAIFYQDLEAILAQHKEINMELLLDSICNWLDDGWILVQ